MQKAEAQSESVLIPLHDRVIIQPEAPKETTEAGLDIPDSVKERPSRGIVIAAGPGLLPERPTQVKPGDTVMYQKHGGTEIVHEDKTYLLMQESNIMAIVGRQEIDMPTVDAEEVLGEGIQYLLDNAPKPLFTIVLEEAVVSAGSTMSFTPANIYQSANGEAAQVAQDGYFICKRNGLKYHVTGSIYSPQNDTVIAIHEKNGVAINLLSGDRLDYYPPIKEGGLEPPSESDTSL